MTLEEMYEYYGCNWSKLSRELKIGTTTVKKWRDRGSIPPRSQLVLEQRTKGLFLADRPKIDLDKDERTVMTDRAWKEMRMIFRTHMLAFNGQPITPYLVDEIWQRASESVSNEIIRVEAAGERHDAQAN